MFLPMQVAFGRAHNPFGCDCQNKCKSTTAIAIKNTGHIICGGYLCTGGAVPTQVAPQGTAEHERPADFHTSKEKLITTQIYIVCTWRTHAEVVPWGVMDVL